MAPSSNGFLREYPLIRVDRFTSSRVAIPSDFPASSRNDLAQDAIHFAPPTMYLLTHIVSWRGEGE